MRSCASLTLSLRLFTAVSLVLCAMWIQTVWAQESQDNPVQIGTVALVKGVVTATSEVRELTALAKGSPIYLFDLIETTARSFVVIEFNDQGKLTLRPNTAFEIKDYSDVPGQEQQSYELLKGGLRAVTGALGKVHPDKVTYAARNSTIGIRGTEFVVRLCDECQYDLADQTEQTRDANASNSINDRLTLVKQDGSRQEVSREQLRDLLNGIYVSVIEGVIRLSKDDWFIDIGAGDACFDELFEEAEEDEEGELTCFIRGDRLEDVDPYLGGNAEGLTYWNRIGEDEFVEGNTICEIL